METHQIDSRTRLWFARAFALAASLTLTLVFLALNGWFGVGDLGAMAAWSIPFALLAVAALRRVASRSRAWPRGGHLAVLFGAGAVVGFAWFLVAAFLLGPWIVAFSFPVGLIWLLAGALAGAFMAVQTVPTVRGPAIWLSVLTIVGFIVLEIWIWAHVW